MSLESPHHRRDEIYIKTRTDRMNRTVLRKRNLCMPNTDLRSSVAIKLFGTLDINVPGIFVEMTVCSLDHREVSVIEFITDDSTAESEQFAPGTTNTIKSTSECGKQSYHSIITIYNTFIPQHRTTAWQLTANTALVEVKGFASHV